MPLVAALWLLAASLLAFAGNGRVAAFWAAPGARAVAAAPIGRRPAAHQAASALAQPTRPTAAARRGRPADERVQASHVDVGVVFARTSRPPHVRAAPFAPAAVASGLAPRAPNASAPAGVAAAAHVVAARGALLPYYPTAPPLQS